MNTPLSYANGLGEVPMLSDTIGRAFDRTVARHPDGEAIVSVHQGIRLTWAELAEKVDAYAAGLLALGLEPGDRVGIWSHNNVEWLVTQYATAKAGLVLVNINPAYRRAELEYALNKVGCRALILMPEYATSDYLEIINRLCPELSDCEPGRLISDGVPTLTTVIRLGETRSPGMLNFGDIPAMGSDAERERVQSLSDELQADDAINIQFTSGTTGRPKGATLSHHNILNNGYFLGRGMGYTPADRVCVPVPLYHCFGMVMGNLAGVTSGCTVVYPNLAFDPAATLAAVEQERCTSLYGVPTMFIAELGLENFADYDLSSLRTGCMAGSPCPMEIMKQVVDRMHMSQVIIAYGMTETSPVSCQSGTDDPLEMRVSTVGRVGPHLEIKIVDEAGRVVPRNTPGEYCTRGYSVMLGYWDDTEKTDEAIDAARWMHTGDIAQMNEEGFVRITGRIKDMVIRGGENLYPREIEEYLYRHPAVADAQVIGVPDERYGEELCAWIQLKSGAQASEEDIRAFCKDEIAHHKIPRHIRFVSEFPMTITGKVQKYRMREVMAEELGPTRG
ncbi:MAG: AMP-binding protein [Salinisphaeraceae bacterium]|nr:AMP-binding protein [Salinisphaeraceae bacterium]